MPINVDAGSTASESLEVEATTWTRRIVTWVLPLIVVAIAVYWYGSAGRFATTDNAYLQQDRVDVAAQVSGNVMQLLVEENTQVAVGQPMLQLDDSIFKIAVMSADTRLSGARTEILTMKAAYAEKLGEIAVARRAAEYAHRELKRQRELVDRKLVSAAAFDSAERAASLADGTVDVLALQLRQTAARLGARPDQPVDSYPLARTALSELDHARIDLQHTLIKAPQSGIASHLPAVGSRVEVGRAACAIVSDRSLWVEANFKETDLEWVRPGQSVEIDVDTFAHHHWRGRVKSISQATGAAFSLLPPQNATGNWVKVVQRIPVRIALERREDDPPLRDGMSANVKIDTGAHTRFDRWLGRSH